MAGDFNEIIALDEKKGGSNSFTNSGFGDWIQSNFMLDLGYLGSHFTWVRNRSNPLSLKSRLDRAVCNQEFRLLYPDGLITHLPRTTSDHSPILLSTFNTKAPDKALKPFKFQAMWMQHEGFVNFINQSWPKDNSCIISKASNMTSKMQIWNKEVFGNLFWKKRNIMARLKGIQKSLDYKPNPFLNELNTKLQDDLNTIFQQEEVFWFQKSREKWLMQGDRNTSYFHLTTIVRRRRNRIEGLLDDNHVWISSKEGLKSIVTNFFSSLFTDLGAVGIPTSWPKLFPTPNDYDIQNINALVSMEETKEALFGIGKLKAPGPDGLPAMFYQDFWDTYGYDIHNLVRTCFLSGSIPPT